MDNDPFQVSLKNKESGEANQEQLRALFDETVKHLIETGVRIQTGSQTAPIYRAVLPRKLFSGLKEVADEWQAVSVEFINSRSSLHDENETEPAVVNFAFVRETQTEGVRKVVQKRYVFEEGKTGEIIPSVEVNEFDPSVSVEEPLLLAYDPGEKSPQNGSDEPKVSAGESKDLAELASQVYLQ